MMRRTHNKKIKRNHEIYELETIKCILLGDITSPATWQPIQRIPRYATESKPQDGVFWLCHIRRFGLFDDRRLLLMPCKLISIVRSTVERRF